MAAALLPATLLILLALLFVVEAVSLWLQGRGVRQRLDLSDCFFSSMLFAGPLTPGA